MNHWTQLSLDFAAQRDYLDQLFKIYPSIPEGIRDIDEMRWKQVEEHFQQRDNVKLLRALLKFDLFPIKDSYVACLRRDDTAIARNPATVDRLCGRLYEMGLDKVYEKCTEPKETNRQIGPLFRRWLEKGVLGVKPVGLADFTTTSSNAILGASDQELKHFAQDRLGYQRQKGLDFLARFNGKYIIGEAKFLTDFGGHQNAQFNDAMSTLTADTTAITVAILDGVPYIAGGHKMYKEITSTYKHHNIMSALVLREFLYQV